MKNTSKLLDKNKVRERIVTILSLSKLENRNIKLIISLTSKTLNSLRKNLSKRRSEIIDDLINKILFSSIKASFYKILDLFSEYKNVDNRSFS